ncbi:uncharacterized protein LOC143352972 isoform X7 [Halictus rubicundus]|uniref:uncharacterized protein LOC143352972 isoform X7 n=1 Tax=Halictus rubicundus TaxID=77578 RepID=UPI0040366B92
MSVQKTEISKFARSNHAKNMDLSIGWNRRLLEPFGVWPLSYSNSGVQRCVRWLKYVVSYFLISLICVPLGLFGVFEVEGAYNKLKLFGPMSFFLMVYMKYFNLINNITHFRDCIEQIESDWKNTSYSEDRDIMVENAIFGRRLHLTAGRTDMSESVDDRIANIVRQHVRILKCVLVRHGRSVATNIIRRVHRMYAEFVSPGILHSDGMHVRCKEWETHDIATVVTYVLILVSFGFNIFIFCYIGELIAEQCSRVGEVAYMIDWYNLQGKKKQCLIMIIAMSNSSSKLTAGGMVELSLSTFGDVRIQCAIYVCIFCKCNRNVYKSFKCVGC